MSEFPVYEDLDVVDGETVFKSHEWWKAVVLYEGYRGREIGDYLWQKRNDGWKRQQKYVVRSVDDWEDDKEIIKRLVEKL